jgi:hypothetical protein
MCDSCLSHWQLCWGLGPGGWGCWCQLGAAQYIALLFARDACRAIKLTTPIRAGLVNPVLSAGSMRAVQPNLLQMSLTMLLAHCYTLLQQQGFSRESSSRHAETCSSSSSSGSAAASAASSTSAAAVQNNSSSVASSSAQPDQGRARIPFVQGRLRGYHCCFITCQDCWRCFITCGTYEALLRPLDRVGLLLCNQLPMPWLCNNPACDNLSGVSELQLVGGKACVCGGCRVAR